MRKANGNNARLARVMKYSMLCVCERDEESKPYHKIYNPLIESWMDSHEMFVSGRGMISIMYLCGVRIPYTKNWIEYVLNKKVSVACMKLRQFFHVINPNLSNSSV